MATNRPKLKFLRGSTYTFDVSAAALATHPFKFTADSGSTEYTTGVTLTGTQGQAGASLSITVSDSAPFNLNYYCGTHGMGMGNHIVIPRKPPDAFDSDGEFFSVYRSHLNVTAAAGTLYTGSSGTVYFMAVDENVPATNDSAFLTDSNINVAIDSDHQYGGGYGKVYNITAGAPPPPTLAWGASRALIIGVNQGSTSGGAEYFDISTPGNASAFGDLSHYRRHGAAVSNKTRILYASGSVSLGPTNTIDYYTSATPGTAIDFGDVTGISGTNTDPDAGYVGRTSLTGVSDGTYGIFMGGQIQSGYGSNVIDRVTIMSPGNATDIGDLTQSVVRYSTSTNDDTRGLNIGGYTQNTFLSNMDYITMANTGNATSFGTLSQNISNGTRGNVGNNTIGVFGAGYKDGNWAHQTLLQQVTIQTTATSTSFGNLNTYSNSNISATTNGSRGVFTGYGNSLDIKQIDLSTGGTTTDFGDLVNQLNGRSGASGNAA